MGKRALIFVHGGIIPLEDSAIYALTAWANDCERKLLQTPVGTVLDRGRHREWAKRCMMKATVEPFIARSYLVRWGE